MNRLGRFVRTSGSAESKPASPKRKQITFQGRGTNIFFKKTDDEHNDDELINARGESVDLCLASFSRRSTSPVNNGIKAETEESSLDSEEDDLEDSVEVNLKENEPKPQPNWVREVPRTSKQIAKANLTKLVQPKNRSLAIPRSKVERVLDYVHEDGVDWYRLKWVGYKQLTWNGESDVKNCADLVIKCLKEKLNSLSSVQSSRQFADVKDKEDVKKKKRNCQKKTDVPKKDKKTIKVEKN